MPSLITIQRGCQKLTSHEIKLYKLNISELYQIVTEYRIPRRMVRMPQCNTTRFSQILTIWNNSCFHWNAILYYPPWSNSLYTEVIIHNVSPKGDCTSSREMHCERSSIGIRIELDKRNFSNRNKHETRWRRSPEVFSPLFRSLCFPFANCNERPVQMCTRRGRSVCYTCSQNASNLQTKTFFSLYSSRQLCLFG